MTPADIDQFHEMILHLGLATVYGGVLGIDRDLHRKPAGIRVLALVSLGGAAISMASVLATTTNGKLPSDGILRTIQGVLSGIGFLGAGVIMHTRNEDEVHGITTASAIWISAITGMICGLGEWVLATCTFALTCGVIVCGRWLEDLVVKFAKPAKRPSLDEADTRIT